MNYLPEPTAEGDAPIRNRIHQQITLYLGNYFALPLHLIFVEDASDIENYSAATQANRRKVSELMRDLTRTFGFSFHVVSNRLHSRLYLTINLLLVPQATGDARAELGRLNEIGIIHGVITDDLDTLLYGASLIIERFVIKIIRIVMIILKLYLTDLNFGP